MRTAILQNQFRLSGRTKVVCEVIQILNEMDLVPDVLTLTPASVGQNIAHFFGLDNLRFNYIRVAPIPFSRGGLWQILALNWLTRTRHSQYDLIFNSNNSLEGLNPVARYLHYIYYPLPVYSAELRASNRKSGLSIYSALSSWLLARSQRVTIQDDIYTISEFSREAVFRSYPEYKGRVQIVYPPSFEGEVNTSADRARRCVSVGVFAPAKKQLQQLEIAAELPSIDFWLAGTLKWKKYFRACEQYIREAQLHNAHLWPNMPYNDMKSALHSSQFFLHTMEGEHFGISTVEAIAAGCIPVVNDSGGQREIVPLDNLRFRTTAEAVDIFRTLLGTPSDVLDNMRRFLQHHIQQFSRTAFRENMGTILRQHLISGPAD